MTPRVFDSRSVGSGYRPDHLPWNPHDNTAGRNNRSLRHESPGGDKTPRANFRAVEYRGSNANHRFITDGRPMHDRAVPESDPSSDGTGNPRIRVQNGAILHIAFPPDDNPLTIASHDGREPDAGSRLDHYVPAYFGAGSDPGGRVDLSGGTAVIERRPTRGGLVA